MAGLAGARRLAIAAAAIALAGAAPDVPDPAAVPLKVMALGDSVTVGTGSSHGGGYRAAFWEKMRDAGIAIDMVGGKVDGPETFDNRHQGYEQMPLHELSADVHDKLRTYQPDVVLLLTGSDEARTSSFSPHAFAANLEVMIDRIFTVRPGAKLLVSTLPPAKFGRNQGAKRAVNELLRRTVRERAARGQAIYLVDTFTMLDANREMADTNRPNDAGYERIGEAFADALLAVLGAERIE
jgi:lysophospholipase L1-like esterase